MKRKTAGTFKSRKRYRVLSDVYEHANVREYNTFWDFRSSFLSKLLWRPKTDAKTDVTRTSWFNVTSIKEEISVPKIRKANESSAIEDSYSEKNNFKVKKIKIYPSSEQKAILKMWFGTVRWIYNKCLDALANNDLDLAKIYDKVELRSKFLNPIVRDGAINDFLSNLKILQNKLPKVRHRCKKDKNQSLLIPANAWKSSGIFYPRSIGKTPIPGSEQLPNKLNHDSRLVKNRLGEYYICIPQPIERKSDNKALKSTYFDEGVASIDPGLRTFLTIYSPSGQVIEFGKSDLTRIYRLCHSLTDLKKRTATVTHRKRYKMQKAERRIRKKIENLKKDLHFKAIHYLVNNYHTILLPKYDQATKSRSIRRSNRLGIYTSSMLGWNYRTFFARLLHKVREYPFCRLIYCDETYTSKTCGNCGDVQHDLGRSKLFHCRVCNQISNRDVNAARNILISYVTKNYSLFFKEEEQLSRADQINSALSLPSSHLKNWVQDLLFQ